MSDTVYIYKYGMCIGMSTQYEIKLSKEYDFTLLTLIISNYIPHLENAKDFDISTDLIIGEKHHVSIYCHSEGYTADFDSILIKDNTFKLQGAVITEEILKHE